jgi:hypothetical protein
MWEGRKEGNTTGMETLEKEIDIDISKNALVVCGGLRKGSL